jgi:glyoxylase-like metal-dependent hydrolase (beta-lactamase superfamily II)
MTLKWCDHRQIARWTTLFFSVLFGVMITINASFFDIANARSSSNPVTIHRYESPKMDAVNLYWLETKQGIILVDTGRFLSQARYALEEICSKSSKPIIGILITHPHTDHYGGLPVFVEAAGCDIPIYAAQITADEIKTDRQGFSKLRKSLHGNDFPSQNQIPYPNRIVRNGDRIHLGNLSFQVVDLPKNETLTTTLYYLPEQRILFSGDIVTNQSIPFLVDGNSQNWLTQLQVLLKRYPEATVYSGHGNPGSARSLITAQIKYIESLRQLVANALSSNNKVTLNEKASIVAAMKQQYPDYETSLLVPNLLERGIDGVSKELGVSNQSPK